jgi:3-isopropylmalate dehydratase small subunit
MTRERLLNGWDDIGLTLRHEAAITSFESTSERPSLRGVFDAAGRTTR